MSKHKKKEKLSTKEILELIFSGIVATATLISAIASIFNK